MKKIVSALLFALIVAIPISLKAQANTLVYDYVGATPTVVATYTQAVTVDGTNVLATPACVAKGTTDTTCTVSIPALGSGTHTIAVAATLGGITAQTTISGLNPNNAPKNATNPRVIINITINVP